MNNKDILDSSALLALIDEEKGADIIKPLLKFSIMSAVNVAAVLSLLQKINITPEEGIGLISNIIPEIIPFDLAQAQKVAELQPLVQNRDLSFEGHACISLGINLQLPIYTADQTWQELEIENIIIKLI